MLHDLLAPPIMLTSRWTTPPSTHYIVLASGILVALHLSLWVGMGEVKLWGGLCWLSQQLRWMSVGGESGTARM